MDIELLVLWLYIQFQILRKESPISNSILYSKGQIYDAIRRCAACDGTNSKVVWMTFSLLRFTSDWFQWEWNWNVCSSQFICPVGGFFCWHTNNNEQLFFCQTWRSNVSLLSCFTLYFFQKIYPAQKWKSLKNRKSAYKRDLRLDLKYFHSN